MKYAHYDKKTGMLLGFYDDAIHPEIPEPNIKITEEQWQEAISNNYNYVDPVNMTLGYKDFRSKEEILNQVKEQKINEINKVAEKKIVSGFTSSALGSPHLYQSEPIDQLNLLGVVQTAQLTNENQLFKCSPDNGKTWEYKEHTPEQLVQVLKNGKETKISILLKANELKEKVKHATSAEEIQQITWEDNNE